MKYNVKIAGRVNAALSELRDENAKEHERRTQKIYREIPEIAEIDGILKNQWHQLCRLVLSDADEEVEKLKEQNLNLQMLRAELLTQHGYPVNYLDSIVNCSRCGDTGFIDGRHCECFDKLYNSMLTDDLSALLKRGDECFENFNISLYPDSFDSTFSCVPREYMQKVFEVCRNFAEVFPGSGTNLMLCGNPGLGKTYLSACIARRVAERGFSVCYESASAAFDAFDKQKFEKDRAEQEKADEHVFNMLSCDLMILDDLGTELVTPSSSAALYKLINERGNSKKPVVISTTLSFSELEKKYSPSICSRLEGDFTELPFAGNDIRKILKYQK